jgi:hypothetical protein
METMTENTELREVGVEVPSWIDQDITIGEVCQIVDFGCASGAYMPAVTYSSALNTMERYSVEVFDWLDDYGPSAKEVLANSGAHSWSSIACDILSAAVESWSQVVYDEIAPFVP